MRPGVAESGDQAVLLVSDGRGGTASAHLNVTGVNSAPSVDPLTCTWELIQPSQGVQLWIEGESCDSNGWVRIRSELCPICWGQVHAVARDPWGAASSDCGTRIYGQ